MLRAITEAESAVGQSLLAGIWGTAVSGLPRRTVQAVRRRLFLREWFHLRYVPDFAMTDTTVLTMAIAQPYLDASRLAARLWSRRPEAVLLWASPELLFGVFASSPGAPTAELRRGLSGRSSQSSEFFLSVDAREPAIPIYFDFEGVWARATGAPALIAYPQSLPGTLGSAREEPMRPKAREAMLRLVARPFLLPEAMATERNSAGMFGAQWERRCLQGGQVARRVFLDPSVICQSIRPFPGHLALVHGSLRPGQRSEALYRDLLGRCGLRPFLFATDGRSVLIGTLSSRDGSIAPRPSDDAIPVLPVLQAALSSIVAVREPLENLEVLVNHRYDRPLLRNDPLAPERGREGLSAGEGFEIGRRELTGARLGSSRNPLQADVAASEEGGLPGRLGESRER